MQAPRTILVINVSRIGDTLFVTPALRSLAAAWPQAAITVLAHPKRAEVLDRIPFAAKVGRIDKQRAPFLGHLPGKPYDLALVYGRDLALVAYALRVAKRVVAFRQGREDIDRQLYLAVDEAPPHSEHAVDRALRLPRALGLKPAGRRLALHLTDKEQHWAAERLKAEGLAGAHPLIGLQVASFPTKAYRDWPVENFAELCRRVLATWPAARFLIFGGPEDKERTAWLKQELGARAGLMAGKLSLRQTAAMMSLVDGYVGVDTGPTHIMSTFDIPMVGLYHARFPRSAYGPLDHPLDFSLDHPRQGSDPEETVPMAEITVDTVWAQLRRALAASAGDIDACK